jgi:hypothetical protein
LRTVRVNVTRRIWLPLSTTSLTPAASRAISGKKPPETSAMPADPERLVLEHLRAIRAGIADIKRDVAANSLQLSAIGQQLAGLTAAVYAGKSGVDELKRRVERIEQHLELTEE